MLQRADLFRCRKELVDGIFGAGIRLLRTVFFLNTLRERLKREELELKGIFLGEGEGPAVSRKWGK